MPLKRHLNSE